jgi:excinuclease UvrABC ATPase subunit
MAINEAMKWPGNKLLYDQNYLRLFGERCDVCDGRGFHEDVVLHTKNKIRTTCLICGGLGYVEKTKT